MKTLLDGAVEAPLDALGKWQGGSTPSKANPAFWESGTIPWVSPKDFRSSSIASAMDKITEIAISEGRASIVPSGSLLFVTRSGILKHSLPVATNTSPVAINQDVKALTLAPGFTPDFFRYQIQANAPEVLEATSKAGTTVESLDFSALRKFRVRIVPTDKQKKIVTFLDAITSRLGSVREALLKAASANQHLMEAASQSAFSGELTRKWRVENDVDAPWQRVTVGDVAESLTYGSSKKSAPKGKVAVLRMGNIQNGQLDWRDLVFTSDPAEIRKYLLRDGDVLFNRTNSPELVGKTATYRAETPAIAAGYLIVVRCRDCIVPELLTYFLNSPAGRAYSWKVKSDGVSQSNINAQKLAAFDFRLPGYSEQVEIVRRLNAILSALRTVADQLQQAATLLSNLEQAVLREVFHGRTNASEVGVAAAQELLAKAARFLEEPAAPLSKRRVTMANRNTVDLLKAELLKWPRNGVTFEELRRAIPRDYEAIKEALFSLMSPGEAIIVQEFDQATRTMRLKRAIQ